MNEHLVSYANGLVGQYYQTEGNKKLAIILGGAPELPTNAESEAKLLCNKGFDIIRPDYYGYGRSDGLFSIKNCIQTVYDTTQIFKTQGYLLSIYENSEIIIPQYEETIIIGKSFGSWITAILPKFDISIQEIVLLYPRLGYDNMNNIGYPEESDEEFLRLLLVGYKHLYRFAEGTDPYEAMLDIGEFDSIKESSHLKDVKVFIGHGSADDVIWCGRSEQFIQQLKEMNPDGKYHYTEYYGLGHGGTCKEAALKGRLHRRKQFENNE